MWKSSLSSMIQLSKYCMNSSLQRFDQKYGEGHGQPRVYNWHRKWAGLSLGEWALGNGPGVNLKKQVLEIWYLLLGKCLLTYFACVGKLYFWCLKWSALWEQRVGKLKFRTGFFLLHLQSEQKETTPTDPLTMTRVSIQLQKPNLEKHTALGKTVGMWERRKKNAGFCVGFCMAFLSMARWEGNHVYLVLTKEDWQFINSAELCDLPCNASFFLIVTHNPTCL